MPSDPTASVCRQRAAEMRALAQKTAEPFFQRSCAELAEGWEALARERDGVETGGQSPFPASFVTR